MEKYDYRRAIIDDLKDWIVNDTDIMEEGIDSADDELSNWIYDEVWGLDCITGNGTYGYNTEEKCGEYLSTNFDLYFKAAREFNDYPSEKVKWTTECPARHMDTTIRCYLLGECIEVAIKELKENKNE